MDAAIKRYRILLAGGFPILIELVCVGICLSMEHGIDHAIAYNVKTAFYWFHGERTGVMTPWL